MKELTFKDENAILRWQNVLRGSHAMRESVELKSPSKNQNIFSTGPPSYTLSSMHHPLTPATGGGVRRYLGAHYQAALVTNSRNSRQPFRAEHPLGSILDRSRE